MTRYGVPMVYPAEAPSIWSRPFGAKVRVLVFDTAPTRSMNAISPMPKDDAGGSVHVRPVVKAVVVTIRLSPVWMV